MSLIKLYEQLMDPFYVDKDEDYYSFKSKLTEREFVAFESEVVEINKQLDNVYKKYNQLVADRLRNVK